MSKLRRERKRREGRIDEIAARVAGSSRLEQVGRDSASGPDQPSPVIVEARRFSRLRLVNLRTLDLYVVRSFLAAYVICAISFIGFYVIIEAFFKLHKFIPSGTLSPIEIVGAFFGSLVRYHMAMIPTIYVNYMGPILTLAAAMFSLTILNRGNEFTAIKAAGVSIYRVLVPVFALAIVFTGVTLVFRELVIPELREPIRSALALSRSGAVRPDGFYDPVYKLHVHVRRYQPDKKIAEGISIRNWTLSDNDSETRDKFVIDADTMVWVPDDDAEGRDERGHWVLKFGSTQRWDRHGKLILNAGAKGFDQLKKPFESLEVETSLLPIDLETSDQDISYLSWRELKNQYQRQPDQRDLLVKLHHHLSFPLSHIILLFLGIPFVVNFANRSYVLGLAVALLLCAAYFLLSSMSLSLASDPGNTILSPVVAAWLPNMLFGALGLTVFTNMRS